MHELHASAQFDHQLTTTLPGKTSVSMQKLHHRKSQTLDHVPSDGRLRQYGDYGSMAIPITKGLSDNSPRLSPNRRPNDPWWNRRPGCRPGPGPGPGPGQRASPHHGNDPSDRTGQPRPGCHRARRLNRTTARWTEEILMDDTSSHPPPDHQYQCPHQRDAPHFSSPAVKKLAQG